MTTVTTTTYSPVVQPAYNYAPVAQPIPGAQPVYAPALAQAQMPVVALSYTAGTSLPESQGIVTSLDTHRPAHQLDGYHTVLGDYFRATGEYNYCLNALKMSTPVLNKARRKLNLPVGWDLSQNELELHQVFKKKYLKKFKEEIIRLVEEQKAFAGSTHDPVAQGVPAVSVPASVTASSVSAETLQH